MVIAKEALSIAHACTLTLVFEVVCVCVYEFIFSTNVYIIEVFWNDGDMTLHVSALI